MTIYLDIEILDWFQDAAIAALPRWRQHAALRFGLATTYSGWRSTRQPRRWQRSPKLWKGPNAEPYRAYIRRHGACSECGKLRPLNNIYDSYSAVIARLCDECCDKRIERLEAMYRAE